MATHIAFLRAINLGAKRQFPKDAIRAAVERVGCTDVATYINTGNVRLHTRLRSRQRLEDALEAEFLADRGFEVPTMSVTQAELRGFAADAISFGGDHVGNHYVSILKHEPTPEAVAALVAACRGDEIAHVGGRGVHLLLGADYRSAGLSNAVVERHLGPATSRNLTVVRALAELWG